MVKCGHSGRFPSHNKKDWSVSHSPQFKAIKKQPANSEETALVSWHPVFGEVDTYISIWFAPVNISQCSKSNTQKVCTWRLQDHPFHPLPLQSYQLLCRCAWCCASLQVSGDTAEGCPPAPSTWDAPHRGNTSGLGAGRRFEPILSMSALKTKSCICTSAHLATERSNLLQAVAPNTLLMGSLWQQGQVSADISECTALLNECHPESIPPLFTLRRWKSDETPEVFGRWNNFPHTEQARWVWICIPEIQQRYSINLEKSLSISKLPLRYHK